MTVEEEIRELALKQMAISLKIIKTAFNSDKPEYHLPVVNMSEKFLNLDTKNITNEELADFLEFGAGEIKVILQNLDQ
ncbi:MAG: hypothetical protein PWR10_1578 [Halanaerobiales bacterium]|nr:hypothetical protein [Halanaerobiales bacterium]